MTTSWVVGEVSADQMSDERLTKRLIKLLQRVGADSRCSIPAASHGWSETQAAYRFFDNAKVTSTDILSGHREATIDRVRTQPMVLLAQDTTFIDYGIEQRIGRGSLSNRPTNHYLLHPTVAFTPERVNLGVLDAPLWQRPEEPVSHLREQRPMSEKESQRWLDSYDHACDVQRQCPNTLVVSVADREGDIHAWFDNAQHREASEKAHLIVRAKSNRRVETDDEEYTYLWDTLSAGQSQGTLRIMTPRRADRAPRKASLSICYKAVNFVGKTGRTKREVTMYAVYAKEKSAPKGEKPIEWMLLTTMPVEQITMAKAIVAWYCVRWEIELFFRVLKHGCRVEALRLETDARLHNAITLYLIVAWRLHMMTMASREDPKGSCKKIFTEKEWRTIHIMHTKARPPKTAPTLRQTTRMLAQLGGFLARKADGEPGVQSIWVGYQRLNEFLRAIDVHEALK